jgi:hypothetical protein
MVDRYTKAVLTVIAARLVWNIIGGSTVVRPVLAQSGPVHVIVDQVSQFAFQFAFQFGLTSPVPVKVQQ